MRLVCMRGDDINEFGPCYAVPQCPHWNVQHPRFCLELTMCNYTMAENTCEKYGGYLASPYLINETILQEITNHNINCSNKWWIGLQQQEGSGSYTGSSGSGSGSYNISSGSSHTYDRETRCHFIKLPGKTNSRNKTKGKTPKCDEHCCSLCMKTIPIINARLSHTATVSSKPGVDHVPSGVSPTAVFTVSPSSAPRSFIQTSAIFSQMPGSFSQTPTSFVQMLASFSQMPTSVSQTRSRFSQTPTSVSQTRTSFSQTPASLILAPTSFSQTPTCTRNAFALTVAVKSQHSDDSQSSTAAIGGGVAGALFVIAIAVVSLYAYRRRRKHNTIPQQSRGWH